MVEKTKPISPAYWVAPKYQFNIKNASRHQLSWPNNWNFRPDAKPILAQRYEDHVYVFSFFKVLGKFTIIQAQALFKYTSSEPASPSSIQKHIPFGYEVVGSVMREAKPLDFHTHGNFEKLLLHNPVK